MTARRRADHLTLTTQCVGRLAGITDQLAADVLDDRRPVPPRARRLVLEVLGLDDDCRPVPCGAAMRAARSVAGDDAVVLQPGDAVWLDRWRRLRRGPLDILLIAAELDAFRLRAVSVAAWRWAAVEIIQAYGARGGACWTGPTAAGSWLEDAGSGDPDVYAYAEDPDGLAAILADAPATDQDVEMGYEATCWIAPLTPDLTITRSEDSEWVAPLITVAADCLATRDGASRAMRLLERAGV